MAIESNHQGHRYATGNLSLMSSVLASVLLSVFFGYLSFNSLAPTYMHADVIMNSIMSLENITLFYWGQNRLLNILPLVAAPFRQPEANIIAVSWLSSLVTFLLVFRIAFLTKDLLARKASNLSALLTATLLATAMFFALTPKFQFGFVVGHIEYPLSMLLSSWAIVSMFQRKAPRRSRFWWDAFLLLIAVFTNPSIALIIFYVALALAIVGKQENARMKRYGLTAFLSLAAWQIVSTQMSTQSYTSFRFGQFWSGLDQVIINMNMTLTDGTLFAAVAGVLVAIALSYALERSDFRHFVVMAGVLSCGWLVFFSCHKWVIKAEYAPRYFTMIYVLFLCIAAPTLTALVERIPHPTTIGLNLAVCIFLGTMFYGPVVPYHRYLVSLQTNQIPITSAFVSGNYWKTWPVIFRRMIDDKQAIGLAARGKGNQKAAVKAIAEEVSRRGYVRVHCVDERVEQCIHDIENTLGTRVIAKIEPTLIAQMVTTIRITL